jgi:Ca2+-binding EF-hand superfamily protein
MQISNLSTSYLLKELQSGAGLDATTTSSAGQNPPSDIASTDAGTSATPIKASDLGSSQFAADTLSSLLSVQGQTSPGSSLASKLIGDLDTDSDGALSQDEVANAVGASSSDISSKFAKLDGDGDGKLSQSELSSALDSFLKASGPSASHHHHHHGGIAKAEASDLMSQLDTDGNGTLSLDELNAANGTAASTSDTSSTPSTDTTSATTSTTASTDTTSTATTASSDLSKTFASLDTNGDGQLSMDELTKAFAQALAQQQHYAKPFWETASVNSTTSGTQSVTA